MNARTIYFGIKNAEQAANPNQFFTAKIKFGTNDHWLDYQMDSHYAGKVCGLFGTANNDRYDDHILPDNSIMEGSTVNIQDDGREAWIRNLAWANNWLIENNVVVSGTCPGDSDFSNLQMCDETEKVEIATLCAKIADTNIFNDCDVDVDNLMFACNFDLCVLPRAHWDKMICDYMNQRDNACRDAQFTVNSWRSSTFCPVQCGENMHYEENASGCLTSKYNCQEETKVENCPLPNEARCVCDAGFEVWDGQKCTSECPALLCIDVVCPDGECDPRSGNCLSSKTLGLVADNNGVTGTIMGVGVHCTTYFSTDLEATWEEGQAYCRGLGLEMGTARNQAENDLLSKFSPESWIGSRRSAADFDRFENYDGTDICPFWNKHEPNNFGAKGEECVEIYFSSSWNDLGCHRKLTIVCEDRTCTPDCDTTWVYTEPTVRTPVVAPVVTQASSNNDDADNGKVELLEPSALDLAIKNSNYMFTEVLKGVGASCVTYYSTKTKMSWYDGRAFCQNLGLELATARDAIENNLLSDNHPNVWLGGIRDFTNNMNNWIWDPETTNANHQGSVECPFWNAPVEPNNWGGNEGCIQGYYGHLWNDFNCNSKLDVVCERRTCVNDCN